MKIKMNCYEYMFNLPSGPFQLVYLEGQERACNFVLRDFIRLEILNTMNPKLEDAVKCFVKQYEAWLDMKHDSTFAASLDLAGITDKLYWEVKEEI